MPIICKQQLFEYKITDNFNSVVAEWSNNLPNYHHLLYHDLLAIENSRLQNLKQQYVSIYKKRLFIGCLLIQIVKIDLKDIKFESQFRKYLVKLLISKNDSIIICGNILRVNQEGYFFKDSNNIIYLKDILLEIKNIIKKEQNIFGILLKDSEVNFNKKLISCHPFISFNTDATMLLEIRKDWQTFSNYEQSLAKKYKQRLHKIIQSGTNIERRELNLQSIEIYKIEIENLYLQLVQKQSFNLAKLNKNYFVEMKRNLGEKFMIVGYFLDGKMLAFSSYIFYPNNEMEIHYIGTETEKNKSFQLYFNILYDGLKIAIDRKQTKLELGRTAKEAKSNMGAMAEINQNYAWLNSKVLQYLTQSIIRCFDQNDFNNWTQRNPFKEIN